MTTLRWLREQLLPELIHLNPMVAMAFYQSVAMDSPDEAAARPGHPLVTRPRRGLAVLDLVDVPRGAGQTVTTAGR
jgi:hypothetical protein